MIPPSSCRWCSTLSTSSRLSAANVTSMLRWPKWRRNRLCASRHSSTRRVVVVASRCMPAPAVIPMAAVTQRPAAVVSPLTACLWKMMVPAPMKPIPDTTCAAMRDTSRRWLSLMSTPSKPWAESIMNSAAPSATRKCVRKPASLARYSRSSPMAPPRRAAMIILMKKSIV